jgi:trimethylamine--corrinoid protein Co-methyltransferase
MRVLEKTGVAIEHEGVLSRLADAGASVDFEQHIARLPERLIWEALEATPSQFTLTGRTGEHKLTLGDGATHFACQNAAFIEDIETGQLRDPTKDDTADFARLADALPNVELTFSTPSRDCAVPVLDVNDFEAMVANTTKPFLVTPYRGAESVRTYLEMAEIVMGDSQKAAQLITTGPGILSPLRRIGEHVEMLLAQAESGIPIAFTGQPIGGASGPVTIAGTMVVSVAETLSGIVVTQLYSPGTPVYYLGIPYAMDMRSGIAATGAPEHALVNAAAPQIARYYDLPCAVIINTDSRVHDAQAGYEKAFATMLALQARADLVWGIGGMGASLSYVQAVIDNEIVDYARRIADGIQVSVESLAVDVIDELGPGGDYLAHVHTKNHFKDELYQPILSNRQAYAGWEMAGRKDVGQRAKERTLEILETHQSTPLPEEITLELRRYVSNAERNLLDK